MLNSFGLKNHFSFDPRWAIQVQSDFCTSLYEINNTKVQQSTCVYLYAMCTGIGCKEFAYSMISSPTFVSILHMWCLAYNIAITHCNLNKCLTSSSTYAVFFSTLNVYMKCLGSWCDGEILLFYRTKKFGKMWKVIQKVVTHVKSEVIHWALTLKIILNSGCIQYIKKKKLLFLLKLKLLRHEQIK